MCAILTLLNPHQVGELPDLNNPISLYIAKMPITVVFLVRYADRFGLTQFF